MKLTPVYTYDHLRNSRNIRLLRITGGGAESDPTKRITCQLEQYSLSDPPAYYALSYTWGKPFIWSCKSDEHATASDDPSKEVTPIIWCETQDPVSATTAGYLTVTQNLYDALSNLATGTFGALLWIDAISIDQKNTPERNSQVKLMGDIYSSANHVVVWLGKEEKRLEGFHWLHNEFISNDGITKISPGNADDPELLASIGVPTLQQWFGYIEDYVEFCRACQWFNRAWILQEVTLARDIVVLLGNSILDWDTMYDVARCLTSIHVESGLSSTDHDNSTDDHKPLGWQMVRLGRIRQVFQDGGPEAPDYKGLLTRMFDAHSWQKRWYAHLGMLLARLRRFNATDARDKVYSLLGMWSMTSPQTRLCGYLDVWLSMVGRSLDSTAYILARSLEIEPDYAQENTVPYVYTSATALVLEGTQHLGILAFVEDQSRRRVAGLPSWVPDYTFDMSAVPFTFRAHSGFRPVYNSSLPSADSKALTCAVKDSILHVQGASFDTIQEVFTVEFEAMDKSGLKLLQILSGLFRLCLCLENIYEPTGQPREEVLWRTWIADSDGSSYPAPDGMRESFRDALAVWLGTAINVSRAISSRAGSSNTTETPLPAIWRALDELRTSAQQEVFPSEVTIFTTWNLLTDAAASRIHCSSVDISYAAHKRSLGNFRYFDRVQGQTSTDRSLFLTSKGYIGLGPKSMRAEDEVFFLRGSHVPLVLRRNVGKSTHCLVGEAYLHGFMQGEMLTPEFQASVREITIE